MGGVDRRTLADRLRVIFDKEIQAGRDPYRRALQAGFEEDVLARILAGQRIPNGGNLDRLLDCVLVSDEERAELQEVRRTIVQDISNRPAEFIGEKPGERSVRTAGRRGPYVPEFGQPDPIGVSGPEELQQALRAVHVWGGSPSLRELERRSDGVLRRSTVSDMLRGEPSLPDYDRYLAFLRACGIGTPGLDVWVFTWRRLTALKQSPRVGGWMGGMTPA